MARRRMKGGNAEAEGKTSILETVGVAVGGVVALAALTFHIIMRWRWVSRPHNI